MFETSLNYNLYSGTKKISSIFLFRYIKVLVNFETTGFAGIPLKLRQLKFVAMLQFF